MKWTAKRRMGLLILAGLIVLGIAAVLWYISPVLAAAAIGVSPPMLTIFWQSWVRAPDVEIKDLVLQKYPLRVWPPPDPDSGETSPHQQTNRVYANVKLQNNGARTLRDAMVVATLTRTDDGDGDSDDRYEARWTNYMNPVQRDLHPGEEGTATILTVQLQDQQFGRPVPTNPIEQRLREQDIAKPGEWPSKPLNSGNWKIEIEVIGEDFKSDKKVFDARQLPSWMLDNAEWADSVARRVENGYLIEWIEGGNREFMPEGTELEERIRDQLKEDDNTD